MPTAQLGTFSIRCSPVEERNHCLLGPRPPGKPLHEHHLEVDEGNISPIVPYIHLFYAYRLLGTQGTLETNPAVTEREAGTHPGQVTGP